MAHTCNAKHIQLSALKTALLVAADMAWHALTSSISLICFSFLSSIDRAPFFLFSYMRVPAASSMREMNSPGLILII